MRSLIISTGNWSTTVAAVVPNIREGDSEIFHFSPRTPEGYLEAVEEYSKSLFPSSKITNLNDYIYINSRQGRLEDRDDSYNLKTCSDGVLIKFLESHYSDNFFDRIYLSHFFSRQMMLITNYFLHAKVIIFEEGMNTYIRHKDKADFDSLEKDFSSRVEEVYSFGLMGLPFFYNFQKEGASVRRLSREAFHELSSGIPKEEVFDGKIIITLQYARSDGDADVYVREYARVIKILISSGFDVVLKDHPRGNLSELLVETLESENWSSARFQVYSGNHFMPIELMMSEKVVAVVSWSSTTLFTAPELLGVPSFYIDFSEKKFVKGSESDLLCFLAALLIPSVDSLVEAKAYDKGSVKNIFNENSKFYDPENYAHSAYIDNRRVVVGASKKAPRKSLVPPTKVKNSNRVFLNLDRRVAAVYFDVLYRVVVLSNGGVTSWKAFFKSYLIFLISPFPLLVRYCFGKLRRRLPDLDAVVAFLDLKRTVFPSRKEKLKSPLEVVFVTDRFDQGPTGGPGGVNNMLSKSLKIQGANLRFQFRERAFFEKNKAGYRHFRGILASARWAVQKYSDKHGQLFFVHDLGVAYGLSLMNKRYALIYHNQGSIVNETVALAPAHLEIDSKVIRWMKVKIFNHIERSVFTNATKVFFPSMGAERQFFSTSPLDSGSCALGPPMYNAIPESNGFQEVAVNKWIKKGAINFASVGALTVAKGFDLIEPFFRRLLSMNKGRKVHYNIIGEGPLEKGLLHSLERLCIEEACFSFNYLGRQEHKIVLSLLQCSDVYVMMHRVSIFDFATLEAMKCGCAVILSNVGGNPEFDKVSNIVLCDVENNFSGLEAFRFDAISELKAKNEEVVGHYFSVSAFAERYRKAVLDLSKGKV